MVSFGTLGIGLGIGTIAEYGRRTLGIKDSSVGQTLDNMFLTKANAERIVGTLCKVRGINLNAFIYFNDKQLIKNSILFLFSRRCT